MKSEPKKKKKKKKLNVSKSDLMSVGCEHTFERNDWNVVARKQADFRLHAQANPSDISKLLAGDDNDDGKKKLSNREIRSSLK